MECVRTSRKANPHTATTHSWTLWSRRRTSNGTFELVRTLLTMMAGPLGKRLSCRRRYPLTVAPATRQLTLKKRYLVVLLRLVLAVTMMTPYVRRLSHMKYQVSAYTRAPLLWTVLKRRWRVVTKVSYRWRRFNTQAHCRVTVRFPAT